MEPGLDRSETTKQKEPEDLDLGTISLGTIPSLAPLEVHYEDYEPLRIYRRHRLALDSKVRKIINYGLIILLVGITILASILLFLHYDPIRVAVICLILAIPIPIFYVILLQSQEEKEEKEEKVKQERGGEIGGKTKDRTDKNIIYYLTNLEIKQLEVYYVITASQAKSSFRVSIGAIIVGFLTIIFGIGYFYLEASPNIQITTISGISGILLQFIGGAYFFIYRNSLKQMNSYFDQLLKIQDTMLAIQLTKELQDKSKKVELTNILVTALLERSKEYSVKEAKRKKASQATNCF